MQGLQWSHSFAPAAIATLLAAGADVNARNGGGATPLHVASGRWGRPAIVEFLVEAGADLHARDERGRTPLQVAVGEAAIARLLELGADSTLVDDSSGVYLATRCESWRWPESFRQPTVDVMASCIENGVEVTSKSLRGYWGWDADSRRSKDYASDHTLLHMAAAWARDPAVVTLLIEAGADVGARDRGGHTPLHYAALDNDNPAVIAALVDAGADVNAVAALGRTPLHQAASENANPEVVAELLKRGADVTAKLAGGRTAVHEAARGNPNDSVLIALLEGGAEVNARGVNETERNPGFSSPDQTTALTPWGGTNEVSEFAGSRLPLHEAAVDYAIENLWLQSWEVVRRWQEDRANPRLHDSAGNGRSAAASS